MPPRRLLLQACGHQGQQLFEGANTAGLLLAELHQPLLQPWSDFRGWQRLEFADELVVGLLRFCALRFCFED